MTPDQITQLRHALENIVTITNTKPHVVSDEVIGELATKALALLPCPTCNGTHQVGKILGQIEDMPLRDSISPKIPCPDCQQHSP